MAKHNPPATAPSLAHASPLVAEEVPAAEPAKAFERAQPIAPRPEPELQDPALVIPDDPATMSVLVTHGTLRHDGKKVGPGEVAILPAALAKSLEAKGVVRIIRRPA